MNVLRALTGEERGNVTRMIEIERNLLRAMGLPLGGSENYVVEKAITAKRSVLSRGTCRPGLVGSYVLWYWVVGDDKAKMDPGVHDPVLHISRRVLDGNRKLSHVLIDAYIVNADFFGPLPIFVSGNKNQIHWKILKEKLARLMVCSFSFFLPNFCLNQ
jgi:hypothetical protein